MAWREGEFRVLVVSQYRDVQTGGAERYLHEVSKRLERVAGMRLAVLSVQGPQDYPLSPPGVRLWTGGFHWRWSGQVRQALERFQPHALFCQYTVPALTDVALRVAATRQLPVCLKYHSDVSGRGWLKQLLGELYFQLVGQKTLAGCRAVFISSPAFAHASRYLRRVATPLVEAPPGVDPVMARGRQKEMGRFLLFVGKADEPGKGFDILGEAWRNLRRRWPDLDLVVIGKASAREPGGRYVGPVISREELADWYASAAVTVLPSRIDEAFGMVLAEALVAGSPVVGTRVGGLSTLIEEGKNGYLALPDDVDSLTRALEQALKNQARLRRTILKQREAYLARFSWERTAEIVARTLKEAAGRI